MKKNKRIKKIAEAEQSSSFPTKLAVLAGLLVLAGAGVWSLQETNPAVH